MAGPYIDPNGDPRALAAQNSYGRALLERVYPASLKGLLGSGMAQHAAAVMQSLPYQRHVQEARMMGQAPMTPEQWMAQNPRAGQ